MTYCFCSLEGGEDTSGDDTRTWDDTVGQIAISPKHHVAGQLSDRDHIGSFLELDRLLVDKGASIVKDDVWI